MGNIEPDIIMAITSPDDISYPSSQKNTPPPAFEPGSKTAPSILTKVELVERYFLPFDTKHGHLLRLSSYTEAPSGSHYQEAQKISAREIFVEGEFTANSQTVCLPQDSNVTETDAIMRYYIDDFIERLYNGCEKTLRFENNQILRGDFRLAGFLVSKVTVAPAPQSDTGQPRMRRRIKPRKSPPLPEQLISQVIIADNTPAIPSAPDSFPATLFPLITDFNEKGLQVTVLAAEGQTVMLSKEGEIIERGINGVDHQQDRLAILEYYFKPLAERPYFYYESHVDMTLRLH